MRSLTRFVAIGVVSILASVPFSARAVEETLQNDGFNGGTAAYQGGFITGEIAASRFELPSPGPMPLTEVQFLFGDLGLQEIVVLHVWEDNGSSAPGTELFTESYVVVGSASNMVSIDLSAAGIQVNGPFRVGLEFTHDGLPSVARDTDGTIDSANNFILASGFGWFPSSAFGLTGDWVIRAVVDVPETSTDPAVPARRNLTLAPNPFNPATTIQFDLPAAGTVTATVHDLRGRQVATVLDGVFFAAGEQAVPWRSALPSGVYVMRLASGAWAEAAKFTILK